MTTEQSGDKAASYMGLIAQLCKSKLAVGDSPGDAIWGVITVAVCAALEGGLPRQRCELILADLYSGIAGFDCCARPAGDDSDDEELPAGFAADVLTCVKGVAEAYGEQHGHRVGT